MFDVTMTDPEFKREFVNQGEAWMHSCGPAEPDLEIESLDHSLFSRLLAALGLG